MTEKTNTDDELGDRTRTVRHTRLRPSITNGRCRWCVHPLPTDAHALLDAVHAHSGRGGDKNARNAAIKAAVAAGIPLDGVGCAAGLTRERVRQLAKEGPPQ